MLPPFDSPAARVCEADEDSAPALLALPAWHAPHIPPFFRTGQPLLPHAQQAKALACADDAGNKGSGRGRGGGAGGPEEEEVGGEGRIWDTHWSSCRMRSRTPRWGMEGWAAWPPASSTAWPTSTSPAGAMASATTTACSSRRALHTSAPLLLLHVPRCIVSSCRRKDTDTGCCFGDVGGLGARNLPGPWSRHRRRLVSSRCRCGSDDC